MFKFTKKRIVKSEILFEEAVTEADLEELLPRSLVPTILGRDKLVDDEKLRRGLQDIDSTPSDEKNGFESRIGIIQTGKKYEAKVLTEWTSKTEERIPNATVDISSYPLSRKKALDLISKLKSSGGPESE